jgi:hypothetical protein
VNGGGYLQTFVRNGHKRDAVNVTVYDTIPSFVHGVVHSLSFVEWSGGGAGDRNFIAPSFSSRARASSSSSSGKSNDAEAAVTKRRKLTGTIIRFRDADSISSSGESSSGNDLTEITLQLSHELHLTVLSY